MTNIKNLLLLSATTLLTIGCNSTPSSYDIASKTPLTLNESKAINDSAFKTAFITMLPKQERAYLASDIRNTLEKNARYKDSQQSKGASGLMVAAVGGNPLDGGVGGGATLALDLASKIINATSGDDMAYGLYLSEKWLGSPTNDVDEINRLAKDKILTLFKEAAAEFNYDVACKYNCDQILQTYELTRTVDKSTPDQYYPKKLVAFLKFFQVDEVHKDSLIVKLHGDDVTRLGRWSFELKEPYELNENGSVIYTEVETSFKEQPTFHYNHNAKNIITTPLGRKIYRRFSEKVPNWYFAEKYSSTSYALYQGNVYQLDGLSNYKDFRGVLVTDPQ